MWSPAFVDVPRTRCPGTAPVLQHSLSKNPCGLSQGAGTERDPKVTPRRPSSGWLEPSSEPAQGLCSLGLVADETCGHFSLRPKPWARCGKTAAPSLPPRPVPVPQNRLSVRAVALETGPEQWVCLGPPPSPPSLCHSPHPRPQAVHPALLQVTYPEPALLPTFRQQVPPTLGDHSQTPGSEVLEPCHQSVRPAPQQAPVTSWERPSRAWRSRPSQRRGPRGVGAAPRPPHARKGRPQFPTARPSRSPRRGVRPKEVRAGPGVPRLRDARVLRCPWC